ncbi:MAG TPA: ribonuclease R [Ignavibacteriaceae bacterium]|nr:ribonuclease R [Ignavibacteriaceae bacterium]
MKKEIKSFFKKNPTRGFKTKDIARNLDLISDYEYAELKSILHKLTEELFLVKSGKRFKLNTIPASNKMTGTLEVNSNGYGFVSPDSKDIGDIFIASRNIGTAFDGDKVEVELLAKQKGKNLEGQIVRILKRKKIEIPGVLKKSKSFYFITPDDPAIHKDIYINENKLKGAKKGDRVIASSIEWDNIGRNPEGEIIEVLGRDGSLDAGVVALAREFGLKYKFSNSCLNEADKIEAGIKPAELNSRLDFRDKNVFTIDPFDAKDFDDALSVQELENGNLKVGIHIADVSHYVDLQSELDNEAFTRGNSVYFVGKVIPMLPEKLSNNICSLVPNQDRLTYSVIAEISKRGKIIDYKIEKTVINSKRRFTYEEVQDIIENEEGDFKDEITVLNKLAIILRRKRMQSGSFDFATAEIKFELDENGKPIKVLKKEVKESNMLVEEFMLLANKIVATHIAQPKSGTPRPFVFRIHDDPDQEKIFEFARFVKSLGYSFDPASKYKALQFQKLIKDVKGKAEETLINELAIRSMAKAAYSPDNIGHYGLGFKYYSHFTSPIRRYSDLIVHRLLLHYNNGNKKNPYSHIQLDEMCDHISFCERNAIEAERLSVKLKQIEFLSDQLGEEFPAIISGITNFGIFVKITDVLAEGLIRLRDLEDDFYVYDEKKYSLIGKSTKRQFRLGDRVNVKLVRVDKEKAVLDFIIVN